MTLFGGAAVAALAAPALASASIYCVGSPGGVCDVPKPGTAAGLQQALTEADQSVDADLVRIGAGTYTGSFLYASASEIDIEGSGNATVIQGTSNEPALWVSGSGSASVVSDLEVRMGSVQDPQSAIGLQIGHAVADKVRVANPANSPGRAVVLVPEGDLVRSSVLARGAFGVEASGIPSNHQVRDTFISGVVGLQAVHGTWNLERLEIVTSREAVQSNTTVNLRNSLIRVSGVEGGPPTSAIQQLGPGVLTAEHVTIHGGPHLTKGAEAVIAGAGTATVSMKNSIVAAPSAGSSFARYASGGGTANIVVGHSNFAPPDPSVVGASTGPGLFQQTPAGTNTNLEPRFVDTLVTLDSPGVDFRLRHDSSLIDQGEPGGTQGDDLARGARVVDGDGVGDAVRDMGAYEYQRQPPVALFGGPDTVAAGQAALFDADPSTDPDHGDEPGLSFSWDFGDGATGSGKQALHSYAAGGTYTVTLTVTDPTGLSATATRQITVAGQPGGAGGDAAGAGQDGAPGGPIADTAAPALSALRAAASRRGAVVRFRISEPAIVTLRFKRRGGGTATWRVRAKAGLNRVSRRLRAGRWQLTASAVDAAGNRSRPSSARFRLRRR
jgi:hypothetical protein